MATTKKDKDVVVLDAIDIKTAEVTIVGDTDLILNKTAASYERECIAVAAGKTITKDEPNYWEDVLTSVRWNIPFPKADTRELTEEDYKFMLENGKPCISAYGLYKSFGDAVVRNEIDTYATKIKNAVSVLSENDRIPISFATASIEEKLMPLKKGGHTVAVLNRFSGWSATFTIRYTENVYNREKILNIINLAGFGLGIGSGRPSGYGRYHIESVR